MKLGSFVRGGRDDYWRPQIGEPYQRREVIDVTLRALRRTDRS